MMSNMGMSMSVRHLVILMMAIALLAALILSPPSALRLRANNNNRRSLTTTTKKKAVNAKGKSFHIFQASPPHTGSTVVTNWLMGLFEPNAEYSFMINNEERMIVPSHGKIKASIEDGHIVTKTHIQNFASLYDQYHDLFDEIFFVASNRGTDPTTRINDSVCQKRNVLCIEYEEVLFSNGQEMETVVGLLTDKFRQKFGYFFGDDSNLFGVGNQARAVKRLGDMMAAIEELVDEPFTVTNSMFGVHGGHRNRDGSEMKGGTSATHLSEA